MQTLFEWDFRNLSEDEAEKTLIRNGEEFAPGNVGDFTFMKNLLKGVLERRPDLDLIIEKAAPEWPIDRISPVDRAVLRVGLYELLFADRAQVPAKVAINEAIEVAKSYGGENSGKFVNGVLGAVYKELGEPGKDEVSKKRKKDVPYEEMPVERLVGAVVYAKHQGDVYLALVHDIFGHWTLSKGKLIPDEAPETGVVRKIKEEIGLDIRPVERIGENEYVASDPEQGKKRKHVIYFLAESPFTDVKLAEKGGLDDARWFKLQDTLDLNFYGDMLPVVTKAINLLVGTPSDGMPEFPVGKKQRPPRKKK